MPSNEEILNYVMNTPNNTNPAVLRDMLNNNNNGGDPGYDVETETVSIIPEQTVTVDTSGDTPYATLTLAEGVDAPPESLTVVLDGVEHTTTAEDIHSCVRYTADDESFMVSIGLAPPSFTELVASIMGESLSGSITVEAYSTETTVTVSDEFKEAVAVASNIPLIVEITSKTSGDKTIYTANKTAKEIIAAMPLVYNIIQTEAGGGGGYDYTYYTVGSGSPSYYSSNGYTFELAMRGESNTVNREEFVAATLDDYPIYIVNNGK